MTSRTSLFFADAAFARIRRSSVLGITAAVTALGVACGPSVSASCEDSDTCGDQACGDTTTDPDNCGSCGVSCGAGQVCVSGMCSSSNEPCAPGTVQDCYDGPAGTASIGSCSSGTRSCDASGQWGACEGQVTPTGELCGNGEDDNCNGSTDEDMDQDGDGYTTCAGDCCDAVTDGCGDPVLVNPGAFEVAGNMVDDDCDGLVDNPLAACDAGLPSNSADPLDYAAALDLCQIATDERWGVVSARLVLPDGTGAPHVDSRSIRPGFGQTPVQRGNSLVVFSTGHAASLLDINPSYAAFENGEAMGTASEPPADWLAANGGVLPSAPACPPPNGTQANDAVMLELEVKTPTNARSFRLRANFFSAEYPEWVCSAFNDFFVALLDSTYAGLPPNPPDKNLARYVDPAMAEYPVGVNLAFGDTGLFQVCQNGTTGCIPSAVGGSTTACTSVVELQDTGFDQVNGNGCTGSPLDGGGTGWLVTSGNVVGGEVIKLRLAIWDTSDNSFDSVVLLDDFEWSVESTDPGTVVVD